MYLNVLNFHKKIIKKFIKAELSILRDPQLSVLFGEKTFVCMTFAPG